MSDDQKNLRRGTPRPAETQDAPPERFPVAPMGSAAPDRRAHDAAAEALALAKRQGERRATQIFEILQQVLRSQRTLARDLELIRNRLRKFFLTPWVTA